MKKSAALAGLLAGLAWAGSVEVQNPYGDIAIRSAMGVEKPEVQVNVPSRPRRAEDVSITESPGVLRVRAQPADKARVDIEITLPYTGSVEATTKSGAISLTGLVREAHLVTDDGAIHLSVPWRMMRIWAVAPEEPAQIEVPQMRDVEFVSGVKDGHWNLLDVPRGFRVSGARADELPRLPIGVEGSTPPRGWLYGSIRVDGKALGRLELVDLPVAADSWVKPPELAPALLAGLLTAPAAKKEERTAPQAGEEGTPLFVSDVRMVNLFAPVYGREGRPLAGLRPEDFEVLEDGVVQKVAFAGSEELPFNLVLLLDLSTTTLSDRAALKAAARGFIGIARPQDRVAVYALAEGYFQVISPLTAGRGRLVDVIDALPPSGGTTPLYDAVVLACAQEGLAERQERSALVILSDGIDNALHKSASGSMVPFDELLHAAAGMPVLMYPVLLPPPSRATSRSAAAAAPIARHRMQQLADASGGRLFPANSIQDLAPVYEQVAQELRSVYTISYYPHNQNFDGNWRRVQVHAKHLGATLRTRDGYYAR